MNKKHNTPLLLSSAFAALSLVFFFSTGGLTDRPELRAKVAALNASVTELRQTQGAQLLALSPVVPSPLIYIDTLPATNITNTAATLRGEIQLSSLASLWAIPESTVSVWFQYSLNATAGGTGSTSTSLQNALQSQQTFQQNGITYGTISKNVSNLQAGKTYYYRFCAKGTGAGQIACESTVMSFVAAPVSQTAVSCVSGTNFDPNQVLQITKGSLNVNSVTLTNGDTQELVLRYKVKNMSGCTQQIKEFGFTHLTSFNYPYVKEYRVSGPTGNYTGTVGTTPGMRTTRFEIYPSGNDKTFAPGETKEFSVYALNIVNDVTVNPNIQTVNYPFVYALSLEHADFLNNLGDFQHETPRKAIIWSDIYPVIN